MQKRSNLAYIPEDANVLSKGTPFMGEEVEIHKKNDIHKSVCHFFVKKCFFDLISRSSHRRCSNHFLLSEIPRACKYL